MNEEELENWKPIIETNNKYLISNKGRVKRIAKSTGAREGLILKPSKSGSGYMYFSLRPTPQIKINLTLHRLLAIYFIENPNSLPFVNHIDGNKLNNCLSNLEWITRIGNCQHAAKLGLCASGSRNGSILHPELLKRGSDHPNAKLNEKIVSIIKIKLSENISISYLAKEYNVSHKTITNIRDRKAWNHVF